MSWTDQDLSPDGGALASLGAKIDLHIGSTEKMARQLQRSLRKPPAQPVFGRTAASGLFVTNQLLVLRFPLKGPDQGHFWYVRNIIVGGLTTTTTAAGRADVFVSAADLSAGGSSLATIGLADWRDESLTLPNTAFYGHGELPLRMNEEIYVAISGGTNGQQYVAAVGFEDYEESAAKQDWSL